MLVLESKAIKKETLSKFNERVNTRAFPVIFTDCLDILMNYDMDSCFLYLIHNNKIMMAGKHHLELLRDVEDAETMKKLYSEIELNSLSLKPNMFTALTAQLPDLAPLPFKCISYHREACNLNPLTVDFGTPGTIHEITRKEYLEYKELSNKALYRVYSMSNEQRLISDHRLYETKD